MTKHTRTQSFNVRMDEHVIERIEALRPLVGSRSRNDYINRAVQFYNAYLMVDDGSDVFKEIIGGVVEDKMNKVVSKVEEQRKKDVHRLASNQFKIATELAKLCLIIADNLKVPFEKLTSWHVKAVREVKDIDGVLGFENRETEEERLKRVEG